MPQPTYEDVCTGRTGCNEVVKLVYDPAVISTREVLEIFFVIHDPTTLNRQGNDARHAVPQRHLLHQRRTAAATAQALLDELARRQTLLAAPS